MVKVCLHRGIGKGPRQNSLEGVKAAEELGIPIIELDIHFSSDRIPVLYHDRWLNGKNIYDYPLERLLKLGIDPLEPVFDIFNGTVYIDLKEEPTNRFFDIIEGKDVIIGSFNGLILRELSELGFKTSFIFAPVLPPSIIDEVASSLEVSYVNPGWEHHLPKNYLQLLGEVKTPIISWTENNEDVFRSLLGVADIVMTDRVDLAKKYGGWNEEKGYRDP